MRSQLEKLLQSVHDERGLGAQHRAVDDVQLVRAVLRQPPLQVVTVLAWVQATVPIQNMSMVIPSIYSCVIILSMTSSVAWYATGIQEMRVR